MLNSTLSTMTLMIYFRWSLDRVETLAYNIVLKRLVEFYSYFNLTLPTKVNHD